MGSDRSTSVWLDSEQSALYIMKFRRLKADFHGNLVLMIERPQLLSRIKRALKRSRVVALIGPRQSGKTTLARQIVSGDSVNYFDL